MKPFMLRLSSITPAILFPVTYLFRKRSLRRTIAFFAMIFFFPGCFQHYFRTNTKSFIDTATLQRLQNGNKFIIIHFKDGMAGLKNISLNGKILEGDLTPIPGEHAKYINPNKNGTNRVRKADKFDALTEVHLYTDESSASNNHISVPISSFNRIDVYEFDATTTTLNHTISIVGITLVAATAAIVIAFAITCNCPQVYVNNAGKYEFTSGLYSGAVYSSLERTDYLPLPSLQTDGNKVNIRIDNAPQEKQFINQMQLVQIDHSTGIHILPDRHGKFITYLKLQAPTSGTINDTDNVTEKIARKDKEYYSFTSRENKNGFSNIVVTFNRAQNTDHGKLVIHAKNSNWSGFIYHDFSSLFGSSYEKWRDEKEKSDPKEMEQWQKDQALPIMVYIENGNEWKFVDYFQMTGNTASRDMIMDVSLPGNKSDQIKIKLESTYMFWDIDFVGMDFSEDQKIKATFINPFLAETSGGTDQLDAISKNDNNYCHLTDNESLTLQFKTAASQKAIQSSFFLVGSGYYHNLHKSKGQADINQLIRFRERGYFDKFSRDNFLKIQQILAANNQVASSALQ